MPEVYYCGIDKLYLIKATLRFNFELQKPKSMFICLPCLTKYYNNSTSVSQSKGKCEVCGNTKTCSNIPSSQLRPQYNPNDLLTPRIKIIYGWPECKFSVGQILFYKQFGTRGWFIHDGSGHGISLEAAKKYPKLIKHLNWWEDRKPEQMPAYLRNKVGLPSVRKVVEHNEYEAKMEILPEDIRRVREQNANACIQSISWPYSACEPATEEEYLEYRKSHKNV